MNTRTIEGHPDKTVLDRIEGGYALMIDRAPFGEFLFVGSESEGGQSRLIRLDTGEACTATNEIGGMMHILPTPGGAADTSAQYGPYIAAMGMYAPFIGQGAAVYMLYPGDTSNGAWNVSWSVQKLFDMPFVHRLGFLEVDGTNYLFVATVSHHKDYPEDWSRPGEVYVVDFDTARSTGRWDLTPMTGGLYRNHGMWVGQFDGEDALLVSGAEGLFAIRPDSKEGSTAGSESRRDGPGATGDNAAGVHGAGFHLEPIITEEISEMVPVDLDGDGVEEMVTIEPFHGHRLRVYKRSGSDGAVSLASGTWNPVWQTEDLSFAHGLNVIPWGTRSLTVVGNRRGGKELLGFDFAGLSREVRRFVLDENVGPTQIEPLGDRDEASARLVSCNQAAAEVSVYCFPVKE
ncbi:MAG: hypothetical protein ACOC0B_02985 [bacterium]